MSLIHLFLGGNTPGDAEEIEIPDQLGWHIAAFMDLWLVEERKNLISWYQLGLDLYRTAKVRYH